MRYLAYMFLQPSRGTRKTPTKSTDAIILIYQYFIHRSHHRQREIEYCLQANVSNPSINAIYLLNERIYSEKELGTNSSKIKQVNVGKRLFYKDVFEFVEREELRGYIVICNADIFFDKTVGNLLHTNIHEEKVVYAQLRFEYTNAVLGKCKLFGWSPGCPGRADSQDTWIFHSNFNASERERKPFNFPFGKLGCDNKAAYLFAILGYDVRNDPYFVKTYHFHTSQTRDYSTSDRVLHPYLNVAPYINGRVEEAVWAGPSLWAQKYGYTVNSFTSDGSTYVFNKDNNTMREFIEGELGAGRNFSIPRVAGVEMNVAFAAKQLSEAHGNPRVCHSDMAKFQKYVNERLLEMKNNAGIFINSENLLNLYSKMCFQSFQRAKLVLGWAPWDRVFPITVEPHKYIHSILRKKRANSIYAEVLSIFNYVHNNPWTTALRGKRVLLISAFVESIKNKVDVREKIYGVDLFPECEFVFLKPPQTQGNNPSRIFIEEFRDFTKEIDAIKQTFDVALVSCGGYGNLVCDYIYGVGKSAILVGGVLQMYFGVYGSRWLRENKDILTLYMNKYWSRPTESERPSNYANIEGACYF